MRSVTMDTLKSYNALLIPDVTYGLRNYPNEILEKSAPEYLAFLRQLTASCESAGLPAFADFYFARLLPEEQTAIMNQLSDSQRLRIRQLISEHAPVNLLTDSSANPASDLVDDTIYFQFEGANDPDLELLADLTARELLFSTFYFTRPICTVWGNWGLRYPCFYKGSDRL